MIRLFVRHPVTDFATWKQAYDDFDDERKGMAVAGHEVFQSVWIDTVSCPNTRQERTSGR